MSLVLVIKVLLSFEIFDFLNTRYGISMPSEDPVDGTGNQTGKLIFNTVPQTLEPISFELVYQPFEGQVKLSYSVEVYLADGTAYYDLILDAETLEVLKETNGATKDQGIERASLTEKYPT